MAADVIEAGDPYRVAWAAVDAARRGGVPALAFCHSNLEAMARLGTGRLLGPTAARAARAYARRVYSRFDAVVAPSLSMCAHLEAWGVPRVEHQPLGVDGKLFHPSRASSEWRHAVGVGPNDRLLVYAGRLAAEKHLHVLTAAVDLLGAPYTLLLIGDRPCLLQGRRQRHLPFLTGATDLATAVASADAFLHAGDQETFGLSVLEALACGTPVVARRREGLAELVDETVGVAVDRDPGPGDARAFAEAIAALFDGGIDIAARGCAARERASKRDWDSVLPGMLTRYERMVAGRPGRASAVTPGHLTTSNANCLRGTP